MECVGSGDKDCFPAGISRLAAGLLVLARSRGLYAVPHPAIDILPDNLLF